MTAAVLTPMPVTPRSRVKALESKVRLLGGVPKVNKEEVKMRVKAERREKDKVKVRGEGAAPAGVAEDKQVATDRAPWWKRWRRSMSDGSDGVAQGESGDRPTETKQMNAP